MVEKKHIVVGAGPAGLRAIETIRSYESDSSITLISDEVAYSRMVVPYYLSGDIKEGSVLTADKKYFDGLDVITRFGSRLTGIDSTERTVTLSDGNELPYDNLLIATGSSATRPSIQGSDLPGVQNMWDIEDAKKFLADVKPNSDVVIVGAGFIGLIILDGLNKAGHNVTFVELESHILPRMIDSGGSSVVEGWLSKKGVKCINGTSVVGIKPSNERYRLDLRNGTYLDADAVIVATGIKPNMEFAEEAGIETGDGIVVNNKMATNVSGVYAAGDVAQGPVLHSSIKAVHAIQPTAFEHGRVAGANMAGKELSYSGSLGFNVVDAVGLQVASFGDWQNDSDTTIVSSSLTSIYRRLSWNDDSIVGAVMIGRATDIGSLNDVGMIKGFIQSGIRLGQWKDYIKDKPLDIRKPYVACKVAENLLKTTLTGQAAISGARGYRISSCNSKTKQSKWHEMLVSEAPDKNAGST